MATTTKEAKLNRLVKAGADQAVLEDELEDHISGLFSKGVDVVLELVRPNKAPRHSH